MNNLIKAIKYSCIATAISMVPYGNVMAIDALTVDASGSVGVGTSAPTEKLHIQDGNLLVEQPAGNGISSRLYLGAGGASWEFNVNPSTHRFKVVFRDTDGTVHTPFKFAGQANTNLFKVGVISPDTIEISGNLIVYGTVTTPDYVFSSEYKLETIEDHANFMWNNRHLPGVEAGKVNEEGKSIVNVGARSQGVLEELEKAHIYIAQLNDTLKKFESALQQQSAMIDDLRSKIK